MANTAANKAKELINKFKPHAHGYKPNDATYDNGEYHAKQCAIICVDEILNAYSTINSEYARFWAKVKTSIHSL